MTERPTPRAQQRTARVPDGRAERIARLAGLAAGIAGESALELLRRATGAGERGGSLLMTSANSARVAETLADLRGAAMKLGQLLSLQGEGMLPPRLREALAQLQSQAHFMPEAQVRHVLAREFGRGWKSRFAEFDWVPIRYLARGYPRETLAGLYRLARVALVTPLHDGMNLVAKEFVAAQDPEDPGVLVLSEFAGAAEQMPTSLLVNPHDTAGLAEAIHRALLMPLAERRERWQAMDISIRETTIAWWRRAFLAALDAARA